MELRIAAITSRSVTVERINSGKYESIPCSVYLNDQPVKETSGNVISVFGLEPDSEYSLSVREGNETGTVSFCTKQETLLLDVHAFGAKGDGLTNDAPAIQAAIACCPKGGTVYLPRGTYLSTPLFAKSDMTIWIDEGAVLLGVTDRNQYPVLPGMVRSLYDNQTEMSFGSWEGNPLDCFAALLTAVDAENLTVMGQGIINGNADASDWWIDRTVKRIAWRPRLIFLNHCRNVTVQGLNIRNSPSWTIHPYYSSDLKFLDLTIENPYNSPNTDGFDPESCTDVLLLGTRISVGDDCVAIKSGKLYMASAHHRSSERIEIRNCLFEHGHGSVTIGSEIAGGVRDVHVSKCRFIGTDRGVRIKTRRGRGERSVLSDLLFEEILMERVNMPVTVNMHYFCDPDGHSCYVQSQEMRERDYLTPSIGTITLKNTECRDVSTSLVCACGLPESPIGHITLENITASFIPEQDRKPAVPLMMDGFEPVSGESLWLKNVVDLDVNHLNIQGENIHDPVLLTSMNMRIQDAVINGEPLRTVSQN